MRAARLPASKTITLVMGLVEIATAVTALALGGVAVLIAAILYVAFSIFTLAAVRQRFPIQSCGCFGREDTPPSYHHVVFNVVAFAALSFLTIDGVAPLDWSQPIMELTLYLAFVATGVYAAYLTLSRLPQLLSLAGGR